MNGIDVSRHNGNIDLEKVKADSVIIRLEPVRKEVNP